MKTLYDVQADMLSFEDFFGGGFIETDEIMKATTEEELLDIIDRHENRLDDMVLDAKSHLLNFKRKILPRWKEK